MKKIISAVAIIIFISFLAGCGETVKGAKKDTKRVGRGIRTIFKSD